MARHLHQTPAPANLFVNLHPADLEDEELYADDGALTPFASNVVLEITERAALDRIHELQSRVKRLRSLGYRIAIDDLGAGYAGLTSFAQLEPEVVKVDMSLIRGIDSSPVKQKLVRSIVALCTELDIQLVAEGIETPAERDSLDLVGGDLRQGYLFARPGLRLPDLRFIGSTKLSASSASTCASGRGGVPALPMTWVAPGRKLRCSAPRRHGPSPSRAIARAVASSRRSPRPGRRSCAAAALHQEGRLVEGQPVPLGGQRRQPRVGRGGDAGMQDCLQPDARRGVGKDEVAESLAVDGSSVGDYDLGPGRRDVRVRRGPGSTTSRASASASTTGTPRAANS